MRIPLNPTTQTVAFLPLVPVEATRGAREKTEAVDKARLHIVLRTKHHSLAWCIDRPSKTGRISRRELLTVPQPAQSVISEKYVLNCADTGTDVVTSLDHPAIDPVFRRGILIVTFIGATPKSNRAFEAKFCIAFIDAHLRTPVKRKKAFFRSLLTAAFL